MSLDEQFDPTSRLKFSKFSFFKRDAFCRKYKHKNVGHKLLKLQRGIALLSHHLKVFCNPLRNPDSEHLRLIADSCNSDCIAAMRFFEKPFAFFDN